MPRTARNTVYDQRHFADLFESYKNLVYKTASLMLLDAAEAEEALQEVFLLVYRSLPSYDPHKGAFSTWLYRITINYCLGQRRKPRLELQPLEEEGSKWAGEPVEDSLAGKLEREAILRAISALSDKQRSVIVLRYYWELPYLEISQILEIPLGTVKSRIDLALRTLGQALSTAEEENHLGVDRAGAEERDR